MVEFPETFDFPELDALVPVAVLLLHLLNGHCLAGFGVGGLVDCPKGPVSQSFNRLVLLHML